MKAVYLFLVIFLTALSLQAQDSKQVVRGRIVDVQSKFPLTGATVTVVDSDPLLGATTDIDGNFRIPNVPIGRIALKIRFIGYLEQTIPNIMVSSGKEVVLEFALEESVEMMSEVVVKATADKTEPINDMATVSTRGFNLEETSRYAGSRNDPARMASNFAGVSGANDGRNDIIIRGNSPSGLLWRLEGLDIPSPNHFSTLGSTGGPVSMLNNNLLANSEFMTGAFPAEYGNALSGAFDLRMRNGNNEKREYLGQIGFNGFELGAEGPFSKNSRASYLINYRYSLLAFFDVIGVNLGTGTATPYFQDLSFKLNFPTKKNGAFTVFGVGGISNIDLLGSETSAEEAQDDLYGDIDEDTRVENRTGILGASYLQFFGPNTYWKNIVAVTGTGQNLAIDTLFRDDALNLTGKADFFESTFNQTTYTYNTRFNHKFNAKNTITAGANVDLITMDLTRDLQYDFGNREDQRPVNFNGNTVLLRTFAQWQHRFNDRWTLNTGLNYQQLTLNNNSRALEPRLGVRYQLAPAKSLSAAYGRHNQMQALPVYFIETPDVNGVAQRTNKNLGFTTSDHFVLGYDQNLGPNLRLKVEAYYQNIRNAAVEQRASTFSMLNAGADFGVPDTDSLVNNGTGRNYGLELTLEKFFSDGYYFLVTGSLFESEYQGSDGIWRNTAFNTNFVGNLLAGREWKVGKKENTISLDTKVTLAGNRRFIPIDMERSAQLGYQVSDETRAYENRYTNYFRTDIKFTYRRQHRKFTEEYVVDIQNMTNRANVFTQEYDARTNSIGYTSQLALFPLVQYRVTF